MTTKVCCSRGNQRSTKPFEHDISQRPLISCKVLKLLGLSYCQGNILIQFIREQEKGHSIKAYIYFRLKIYLT